MCLHRLVSNEPASLPADLAAAHAMILAERDARQQAEALCLGCQRSRSSG